MRWGSWTLIVSSFPPRLRSEDWGDIELLNMPGTYASESWGHVFGKTLLVHIDNRDDENWDYDPKGLMEALVAIHEEWRTNESMTISEAAYSLAAKGKS